MQHQRSRKKFVRFLKRHGLYWEAMKILSNHNIKLNKLLYGRSSPPRYFAILFNNDAFDNSYWKYKNKKLLVKLNKRWKRKMHFRLFLLKILRIFGIK